MFRVLPDLPSGSPGLAGHQGLLVASSPRSDALSSTHAWALTEPPLHPVTCLETNGVLTTCAPAGWTWSLREGQGLCQVTQLGQHQMVAEPEAPDCQPLTLSVV